MSNPPVFLRALAVSTLALASGASGKEAIVGGKTITIKEAPWQLLLLSESPDGSVGNCGASWIGGKWVITAAHCVEDTPISELNVYAGISRRAEAKAPARYKVARVIPQPDYPRQWKDIAVLELVNPITAVEARPIRMAMPADVTAGFTRPGAEVMATGWGGVNRNGRLADTLQMVMSQVHDTTRWAIRWAGLGGAKQVGSCGGDSGGPCVVKDATGAWILAGISSTISSFCGDPNSPSSYTRVSSFYTWVMGHTGTVVSLAPAAKPTDAGLLFTGGSGFKVSRAQVLDITVSSLTGALLERTRKPFSAGSHALPSVAGRGTVLRIAGADGDIRLVR